MAIYSRYAGFLKATEMLTSVRTALNVIKPNLLRFFSELEDEFDAETRWAIAWFEQYGFDEGDFGDAELLSKAKVTSVSGLHSRASCFQRGVKFVCFGRANSRQIGTRNATGVSRSGR